MTRSMWQNPWLGYVGTGVASRLRNWKIPVCNPVRKASRLGVTNTKCFRNLITKTKWGGVFVETALNRSSTPWLGYSVLVCDCAMLPHVLSSAVSPRRVGAQTFTLPILGARSPIYPTLQDRAQLTRRVRRWWRSGNPRFLLRHFSDALKNREAPRRLDFGQCAWDYEFLLRSSSFDVSITPSDRRWRVSSSICWCLIICPRMLAAAFTLVPAGVFAPTITLPKTVTAAPAIWCSRAMDCEKAARCASRYAASNAGSFIHRCTVLGSTPAVRATSSIFRDDKSEIIARCFLGPSVSRKCDII